MNKKTNLFIIYVTTLILSLLVLVIVKIVCKVEDIKLVDNFTNIYLSIVLLLSIVSILIWLLLNKKNIKFEYTEEDGCGSLDFMFRGLKFHVWEYEDNGWGAETNIYAAGRSEDIDGDYEEKISAEILSWPDMINN